MRNLVVCCDGSWATSDLQQNGILCPTNVRRIYNAVSDKNKDNIQQLKYYHSGVGTECGWWARFRGGMVGAGLDENIISAYQWLAKEYRHGDRIFIFGFSRGAYTARSLAGMIDCCGLLDLSEIENDPSERWRRVRIVFKECYRKRKSRLPYPVHPGVNSQFLGVWDTVGALGIPDNFIILSALLNRASDYKFHDTSLGKSILFARHAVALDEERASFTPTLWEIPFERKENIEQKWFPGGHGDVGGGCLENGLSDGALDWIMEGASQHGLEFQQDMRDRIKPDAQDASHEHLTGVFKKLRIQPRGCPKIGEKESDCIHGSAIARHQHPPITLDSYWKNHQDDGAEDIPIYVKDVWSYTGIYLHAGETYDFTACGQWLLGGRVKCYPEANQKVRFFYLRFLLGDLCGIIEKILNFFTHNKNGDVVFSKRVEKFPWLVLTGAIPVSGNPNPNGTPQQPEFFKIGKANRGYIPKHSGYLYCFVNDAWGFDSARQGALVLKMKHIV